MRKPLLILLIIALAGCDRGNSEPESDSELIASPEPETLTSTDDMQTGAADFDRAGHPGNALYQTHCADCHNGTVPKAPHFSWLEMMSPAAIHGAISQGIMRSQAATMTDEEKIQVTEYLTRQLFDDITPAETPMCEDRELNLEMPVAAVNWGHDTNRFSPAEIAGLSVADLPKLKLKWAFAFPDAFRARSQPSIAYGAIFVGSQDGKVYALDLETGCAKWTYTASAEIRTGIVVSTNPDKPLVFFGDILARQYALDALTGELVWSIKADDHPSATLTGTSAYYAGKLFVPVSSLEVIPAADPAYECCTFRGNLLALDATTGDIHWRHYVIPEEPREVSKTSVGTRVLAPSGAPTWSSPTVDVKRNLVYIGTGENYSSPPDGNSDAILAINMDSGARSWTRQSTAGDAWNVACMMAENPNCPEEDGPDFDHGSSILLAKKNNGEDILLAGHKNGTVFGLDPDNKGALLWQTVVGRGSIQGGVHFGMAAAEGRVYVPINDMNNTRNGDYLDPAQARPGVHSLRVDDGAVQWHHVQENVCDPNHEFCDPGVSSPVTAIPGAVIAGHLDGFVRIYHGDSGDLLWEYDTRPEITGVNGIKGHGGSMSGAGPAVVGGHLVINSGYGLYYHEGGNLLMVFSVPD